MTVRFGTVTQNVSVDFIQAFSEIINTLFDMASKGSYAVNRTGELMEYHPKIENAETMTGVTLMVIRYFSKKFERCLAAINTKSSHE